MVVTLALIFMVLAFMVERGRRVTAVEAWILFLAGVLFWASGIGASIWVLIDSVFHAVGGH
ncbi:MAG TPA: hypothetical protein VFA06_14820 [Actinocrinis sp.]|jgi:hypothetical protein|uniref:hypothetical protein n=1 Tax=Actinocrinis sp. TaxID=1920516 RepID=UPI002D5A98D4|nr:hypothetical protein [Actinocrinis sp.]HZU57141.1 hypothetical protein [Actinocrinis sp.]